MTDRRIKHGFGRRIGRPPEFRVWLGMRARCKYESSGSFENYGARGIFVSEEWADFARFYADMGPRPSPDHTIERVDNDGPYAQWNCKWATKTEQANNRRPRRLRELCQRGHQLSGENLYNRPDGKRGCRECRAANMASFYARRA